MNIWIINQYASTPQTGFGGRHYYLAKELARQGHNVHLIAAGFTHNLRQPPKLLQEYTIELIEKGFDFVWIDMPKYSNSHDKKRVLNWFLFAYKLLKLPKIIAGKPDVILCSSLSLVSFLGAQKLSKKLKTKLAFEVRDIWPLTLIELGGYSPNHPFIKLLQWIEDRAYRNSDIVISNLPNAVEHMVSRGMNRDKFTWIPNGFDLDELQNAQPLNSEVKTVLPTDKFIVGYTGTLGFANALEYFVEAAKILQERNDIVFVLVGGGKEKQSLVEQAKGLNNILFIDPIPKEQIQSMLAEFDVCYIGWKKEPIYRFGIAPNKLSEYMLSSKPIIHSYSGISDFVKIANAGLSIPAQDPQAIVDAVLKLKSMTPQERKQMGENGKKYALENHDYSKLAQKLSKALLDDA